ncbi:hypothetical protein WICMUC_004481 [Wickerhamomyces mucosus]|uniref:Tricalbin n=1 Tax=Wickerhamomyces mucosus TaxID=1378264 RepID=A0A9P8TAW0_9ASCO|nr:hypothetical protein WICMUC_004481 [Wickerhamomyces mucosus]
MSNSNDAVARHSISNITEKSKTDDEFGPKPDNQQSINPTSQAINSHAQHIKKKANSADRATEPFVSGERYPWQQIGAFNEGKKIEGNFLQDAHLVKSYVAEIFYSDWYWNTALIIGTCFFSWLLAKWKYGILGLIFVLLAASSVYKAEFRRFERNVRDDIQRIFSGERLEKNLESMEWLNSFLSKFWVIYMPALSDTVRTIANETLKDVAPGYGIDALTLDQFTLGSKSPRIDSIKSYTKKGKDLVEMDWAFSFSPDDTSDMTKREIEKKINPKVALGVRVGKGFVSKRLPILVEDMAITGRMKVQLKLSLNFPHIDLVSVQFLEPPKIDFALKPVGGDTFGLDIMSLVPGLSTLITTLINSNVGPMLYAPNHLDIDVQELMAQQSNDAIGIVAVTVHGADKLQSDINPYVQLSLNNAAEKHIRTDIKVGTKSPRWNETKYILVNSLSQTLHFELFNFNTIKEKGELYATHELELNELLQNDSLVDLYKHLEASGKRKGILNYDIRWFPVLKDEKFATAQEDESKEIDTPDSEVGILKLIIHQAKGLNTKASIIGSLNPTAELFVNGKSIKRYRTLRRSNEPSWEESLEFLVSQKSDTRIKLVIKDTASDDTTIATLDETLENIVFNVADGHDNFSLAPQGQIRITALWKPVSLSGISAAANYVPPIGAVRLHLRDAKDLLNLETLGKVDPYVKVLLNNRLKYVTGFHPSTLAPIFEEVVYLPITSESQHITLEVMDDQNVSRDRTLGSGVIPVSQFIEKDSSNSYLPYDGSQKVLTASLKIKNKKPKGQISYSISFLPSIPVYSVTELEELKQKESKDAAKKREQENQLREWKDLYEKNPNDYEWVEIEEKDQENINGKEKMSLEELITHGSGTLGIHLLGGTVKRADTYIQLLVDDLACPSFTSGRTTGHTINPEVGHAFIRDLPNSKLVFRVTKKKNIRTQDQIIEEKIFTTVDLLEKHFATGHSISLGGSNIKIRFEYIPSLVKLPLNETILDAGRAQIEFLDAENLKSADKNGKSDPFVTLEIGEIKLFKSKVVKKSLNPSWNENTTVPIPSRSRNQIILKVWDWDRAAENDLLGSVNLDISNVKPLTPEIVTFKLDTQGTVRTRVTFSPEYIRPKVGAAEFGASFASLTGIPLKAVGIAGDFASGIVGGGVGIASDVVGGGVGIASGVVGGGVGIASGVVGGGANMANGAVGKGGSLIKSVFGGNKPRRSTDQSRSSFDASSLHNKSYASDAQSLRSGRTKASLLNLKETADSGAADIAQAHKRNPSTSNVSTYTTAIRGKGTTEGSLIVHSATGLGNHAQLRVSLAINGKLKEIYTTKNVKSSNGVIRWDEEVKFDAPKEAEIVFGGVIHHTFSKDQELGNTKIKLVDVIDNPRDLELDLGQGQILVSFRYSPEIEEGSATPPPPEW